MDSHFSPYAAAEINGSSSPEPPDPISHVWRAFGFPRGTSRAMTIPGDTVGAAHLYVAQEILAMRTDRITEACSGWRRLLGIRSPTTSPKLWPGLMPLPRLT